VGIAKIVIYERSLSVHLLEHPVQGGPINLMLSGEVKNVLLTTFGIEVEEGDAAAGCVGCSTGG
jgi:hypothetical protein